ncbi:hypothetical protein BJ138DRAFT_1166145 [Hygrophoropsis aurantiaca]|uniref:Uncharacterized protein n=1 Tax=Hygrophoropsis aurantiaca TaxID=72124 RepID=A0ACB7ZUY2_9AGAM|nr:hypothetical protein BJ138DRAFT_1166145 [Hygrophoropsis aurantiaca]
MSLQSRPIKVGVVGLSTNPSSWAHSFLSPALRHAQLAQKYSLVAVSTTSDASAKASAKEQSDSLGRLVKAYSGSTSHIAQDPDVDLVLVAVKAPYHKSAALPAINAGKDCFVEWPVGRNLSETIELAEAARRHRVRTIVGLQGRQSIVLLKAKELISDGKIGRVLSCSVVALAPREMGLWGPQVRETNAYTTDDSCGGSMLDIAVGHHLDALTFVLGSDFMSVSAVTSTVYTSTSLVDADGLPTGKTVTTTNPDHVAFVGLLANGTIASVSFRGGYTSQGRKQLLWEIDGESGSIRVESDNVWGSFVQIVDPSLFLNGVEVQAKTEGSAAHNTTNPKLGLSERKALPGNDEALTRNLVGQFTEFWKGGEGTYADLDEAVKTRRLLEAISESAREGKRVDIQ